jgi:hypothetical protein
MVLGNKGSKSDPRECASEHAREYDRGDCNGTHMNAGILCSGAECGKQADRRIGVVPPDLQIILGPTTVILMARTAVPLINSPPYSPVGDLRSIP